MENRLVVFEQLKGLGRPFANVVQVGANRGQEVSAYENYGIGWAIMVEPQDEAFAKLRRRVAEFPQYIPVQALCSYADGVEHDFYIASNKGQSSSLLKPTRHQIEYPKIDFPEQVKLSATTLDTLVDGVVSQHPGLSAEVFDTLLIDVQGAELKVLMGAVRLLQQVKYVFTEVSFDLYEGGATLEDLQGFLRAFGFQLQYLIMNRHGWGDGLFVKV